MSQRRRIVRRLARSPRLLAAGAAGAVVGATAVRAVRGTEGRAGPLAVAARPDQLLAGIALGRLLSVVLRPRAIAAIVGGLAAAAALEHALPSLAGPGDPPRAASRPAAGDPSSGEGRPTP
jgi:hypothetical protein